MGKFKVGQKVKIVKEIEDGLIKKGAIAIYKGKDESDSEESCLEFQFVNRAAFHDGVLGSCKGGKDDQCYFISDANFVPISPRPRKTKKGKAKINKWLWQLTPQSSETLKNGKLYANSWETKKLVRELNRLERQIAALKNRGVK